MGRIARDNKEVRAASFETRGHCCKHWPRVLAVGKNRRLPVRHARIVINKHANVVLIPGRRRQGDDLRHEIDRGIRSHATQHACDPVCIGHTCFAKRDAGRSPRLILHRVTVLDQKLMIPFTYHMPPSYPNGVRREYARPLL